MLPKRPPHSFERIISTCGTYVQHYASRADNWGTMLAFSYRFGNTKLAPADGAAEEKRRAAQ